MQMQTLHSRRGTSQHTPTETIQIEPLLYNVHQAMAKLGIRKTKLYREMELGRLPYLQSGGSRFCTLGMLQSYVALLASESAGSPTQSTCGCPQGERIPT